MDISKLSLNDNNSEKSFGKENDKQLHYFYTGISHRPATDKVTSTAVCICFAASTNNTIESSITELLDGSKWTSQRAELYALYRAMSCIVDEVYITIISKSQYAVNCANKPELVLEGTTNADLINQVLEEKQDIKNNNKYINIVHYSSHSNNKNNNTAQGIAKEQLLLYS